MEETNKEKEIDELIKGISSENFTKENLSNEAEKVNEADKEELICQEEEEVVYEESSNSPPNEDKLPNSIKNSAKRSKFKDQDDDKKSSCHESDSDSDEDSSKRLKLNEQQPNTSAVDCSENCDKEKVSNFRKFKSKIKKRNYRSQSNSSNIVDESSDHEKANETSRHEESDSSQSIEFQPNVRKRNEDSSDAISDDLENIDNDDSNDWTISSDDDIDEMPAVLQKEPSKSNWSIVKDLVNRQIGRNYSLPSRFYSSLHAVQRLELMYKLDEHLGCVNALDFNQKGNLLASASDDLTVTIWDWAIGKKYKSFQSGHRSNIFQAKFLPLDVESYIVSSARDGQVRLIDIPSGVTRKLASHQSICHKISTHPDIPHVILSAGQDAKVLLIDVRESKPTRLSFVKDYDEKVELYSIQYNPLNNFEYCVAGRTRNVIIFDRRKPTVPLHRLCPKHLLSDEYAHVTCAVYNYNGTEVLGSYNNEDIYLFDVSTSYQNGDFAHRYQGHRNNATVKGVNFFGPKSEFILSGSDCGNIFIWDKKTEAIVQWMPGDEQGIVNVLEPHPHIPILATSGLDFDVKIWIPSREETPSIKEQLKSCVKKNLAAGAINGRDQESAFDGHVLWIMLRHFHQERRRQHLFGRRVFENQTSDEIDTDDDDDDDDVIGDFSDDENDDNLSTSNRNSSESDNHSES